MGRRGQGQDRRPARPAAPNVVCRYQGGPNAGHTIVRDGETFKLHHIPSGILYPGKICVIGAGCVVDPRLLVEEIDELEARGISTDGAPPLRQRAPDHALARRDRLGERAAARPAPDRDDAARDRPGVRRQGGAPRHPRAGHPRPEDPPAEVRDRARREEPPARRAARGRATSPSGWRSCAARLRPYVADTSLLVDRALQAGKASSSRARRARCSTSTTARIRSSPRRTRSPARPRPGSASARRGSTSVIGVAKAYVTRVGEGPFPTEIEGPDQARVRELGDEYGTTTGRERRCGWLDLVALRFAVARQRDDLARAHEARRPLGVRRDPGLRALPASRRHRDRRVPRAPERLPPRAARSTRRCPAGRSRSTARCPPAARSATSSSSRSALELDVMHGRHRRRPRARDHARSAGVFTFLSSSSSVSTTRTDSSSSAR